MIQRHIKSIVLPLAVLVLIAGTFAIVSAADSASPAPAKSEAAKPDAAKPDAAKPDAGKPGSGKVTPYPLTTCLVSDEKLGGPDEPPVTLVDNGQEFKFCCKKCIKKFKEDPAKYHALLKEAVEKAGKGS